MIETVVQAIVFYGILTVGCFTIGGFIGRNLGNFIVYIYEKFIMRERELIFEAIAEYEYARNKMKYEDDWAYSYAQQYACDIVGNLVIYYKKEDGTFIRLRPGMGFEKVKN